MPPPSDALERERNTMGIADDNVRGIATIPRTKENTVAFVSLVCHWGQRGGKHGGARTGSHRSDSQTDIQTVPRVDGRGVYGQSCAFRGLEVLGDALVHAVRGVAVSALG
jgi:hypothetical protein